MNKKKLVHSELPKPEITGEDVAALLSGIHTHVDLLPRRTERDKETIVYTEEDLLPVLKALGLPDPKWGESLSIEEWRESKK